MPNLLPDYFLRCLDPRDRKKLGKGGITAQEAASRAEIKNERQLQGLIVNLLRLRGIEVLWHRTDKKSAATVGWPDLTFSVPNQNGTHINGWLVAIPCAWEVKLPGENLSDKQDSMWGKLIANGWRLKIIRSVDQALVELKAMGL
jgi:hypothetical protein